MDLILFNDSRSIDAFRDTIAPWFRVGPDISISRVKDGDVLGGVVLTNYYKDHSISMHVHSWRRHWMNRELLFICFDYPFNQLKVKHIFGEAREDKIKFDLNIGYKVVARIENFYPDAAKVILRMDRDECRHLDIKPRFN